MPEHEESARPIDKEGAVLLCVTCQHRLASAEGASLLPELRCLFLFHHQGHEIQERSAA